MGRHKNNNTGFAAAETLLVLGILAIVIFAGWFVIHAKHNADKTLNAGSQASTSSGKTYTTDNQSLQNDLNGINNTNSQISTDLSNSDSSLNDNPTFTALP